MRTHADQRDMEQSQLSGAFGERHGDCHREVLVRWQWSRRRVEFRAERSVIKNGSEEIGRRNARRIVAWINREYHCDFNGRRQVILQIRKSQVVSWMVTKFPLLWNIHTGSVTITVIFEPAETAVPSAGAPIHACCAATQPTRRAATKDEKANFIML